MSCLTECATYAGGKVCEQGVNSLLGVRSWRWVCPIIHSLTSRKHEPKIFRLRSLTMANFLISVWYGEKGDEIG